jgi:hypothetical protein
LADREEGGEHQRDHGQELGRRLAPLAAAVLWLVRAHAPKLGASAAPITREACRLSA